MGSIVDIVITAIPEWALATSTFLILAVGAYFVLAQTKVIKNPFKGGEDDSDW